MQPAAFRVTVAINARSEMASLASGMKAVIGTMPHFGFSAAI